MKTRFIKYQELKNKINELLQNNNQLYDARKIMITLDYMEKDDFKYTSRKILKACRELKNEEKIVRMFNGVYCKKNIEL